MRYELFSPDGLEIGYITDEPEFRWEIAKDAPFRDEIENFLERSSGYQMVVAGELEGTPMEDDAVTPPEEKVPASDHARLIRVANALPKNAPVQVREGENFAKSIIARKLANELTKERRYIDSPDDAPEGAEVQEGPQGGLYYETEGATEEEESGAGAEIDEHGLTPDERLVGVHELEFEEGERLSVHGEVLEIVEVEGDPTAGMGPNAGYALLEDGTAVELFGDPEEEHIPDEIDTVHALKEVEGKVVENLPDVTGSEDPAEWNIDWNDVAGEAQHKIQGRNLLRLESEQKEQFKREWTEVASEAGAESVEDTLIGIKGVTMSTHGQKYDKLLKDAYGIEGEPREGEFDDAEEPTEEEVEAMRAFTKASQQFARENYGEEFSIHRGLGEHAVENVMEAVAQQYVNDSLGESMELRDNPAAVFTMDKQMAYSYDKGLILHQNSSAEEVLAMPEALIDFEQGRGPDWKEGEVNVAGWDREVSADELEVSRSGWTIQNVLENPIEAHFEHEGSGRPVLRVANLLEQTGQSEAAAKLHQEIFSHPAYSTDNHQLRDIVSTLASAKEAPKAAKESNMVIDIRRDTDWLRDARDEKSEKSAIIEEIEAIVKERIYIETPEEAPEGVEVHQGEQGGLYYETSEVGGHEDSDLSAWDEASFDEIGQVMNEVFGEDFVEELVDDLPDSATPEDAIAVAEERIREEAENPDEALNEFYRDLGEVAGSTLGPGEDEPATPQEEAIEVPEMEIEDAVGAVASVVGSQAANALLGDMRAPDSGEAPNPDNYVAQAARSLPGEAQGVLQEAVREASPEETDIGDVMTDANDVRDGDVDEERVESLAAAMARGDESEHGAWTETDDNPVPDLGQPVRFTDEEGESEFGVLTGATGFPEDGRFLITSPQGEEEVEPGNITHEFGEESDEERDEDGEEEEETEEEYDAEAAREPVDVSDEVSERPDRDAIRDNVREKLSGVDSPNDALDFETELELSGVTEEEVVEEDADVMGVSLSGASMEQAEEFLTDAYEARDRGWLHGLSDIGMPRSNLHMPESADGAFDPGHKTFGGEEVPEQLHSPKVNINPERMGDWDGREEYVPIDPDEVPFQQYAMYHELGHHNHYENLKEEWGLSIEEIEDPEFNDELREQLSDHSDLITEEISALAANQPFEFAAEVFATMAVGNTELPEGIIEAYDAIGGVRP